MRLAKARWELAGAGVTADLRGLSVVTSEVAWASGTQGTWLRTADGGATFRSGAIPDAADFRSIAALSADVALVLTSGSPARLFRTVDAGRTWKEVFHDARKEIFFDSMAFAPDGRRGWAVGDPIDGRFVLIGTEDGGETWRALQGPVAAKGEGAFAASNSCLAAFEGDLFFATGGAVSRVHHSRDGGVHWTSIPVRGLPASESAGIFSLAMRDARHGAVTGGDYKAPTAAGFFLVTDDGGASWTPGPLPPGYRSSVALVEDGVVVTGPTGTDWSPDGKSAFRPFGDGFNAVAFRGGAGYAVGPKGKVAVLRTP